MQQNAPGDEMVSILMMIDGKNESVNAFVTRNTKMTCGMRSHEDQKGTSQTAIQLTRQSVAYGQAFYLRPLRIALLFASRTYLPAMRERILHGGCEL